MSIKYGANGLHDGTDETKQLAFDVTGVTTGTTRTVTVPDKSGTLAMTSDTGDNTPMFSAYLSANQSLANGTWTYLIFDTELIDSDSAFDTTTGKFTPTTAGYYFVSSTLIMNDVADATRAILIVQKNTSEIAYIEAHGSHTQEIGVARSAVVYLNGSTDYIRAMAYQETGASQKAMAGLGQTSLSGFKLSGV